MAIESNDGMSSREEYGGFSQLGDSLKGMVAGFLLFPISIFMIYKVETCEQAGDVFKKAVHVSQAKDGLPTYVTGKLSADQISSSFVKQGNYISISHTSEVFVPYEKETTEGEGTKKEKVKKCEYKWDDEIPSVSSYSLTNCKRIREKISWDKKYYQNENIYPENGIVNENGTSYSIDIKSIDFTSSIGSGYPGDEFITSNYLHLKDGVLYTYPHCANSKNDIELVGCERIKISVKKIPTQDMTFLGDVKTGAINKFATGEGQYMSAGLGDFKSTLNQIKSDDSTKLWIMRILCFVAMWTSFMLLSGPLTTLVDFIPFIGSYGKGAINAILGVVAFIITAITIIIVKLWWLWLLLIVGAIGYGIYKKKNQPPKTASA